jgi:hypothetical protein
MSTFPGYWRRLLLRIAGTALGALAAGAALAQADTLSYVPDSFGRIDAYLVESQAANRARLVAYNGASEGSASGPNSRRRITLDTPLSETITAADLDCNNNLYQQRRDTTGLLFRRSSGSAALGKTKVIEFGTLTDLDGCTPGRVTPFGSASDPGLNMLHRAMSERAPITDLVPGVDLAGFSEDAVAQDTVRFLSGNRVRFSRSGSTTPVTTNADDWLILKNTGSPRGYTRLSVNANEGETWLQADFAGGQPVTVRQTMMVKPKAGASFGSVAKASREWESGLYVGTQTPFYTDLYQDGSGDRISLDLNTGTEIVTPITWAFDGLDVEQSRAVGGANRLRTWQPLRNAGKVRWVFEDELSVPPVGPSSVVIPFRVNFYIDRGATTPPK